MHCFLVLLFVFLANSDICCSALRWPGSRRQLCRNWIAWDARALLRRWVAFHTEHWQEVGVHNTYSQTSQFCRHYHHCILILLILYETVSHSAVVLCNWTASLLRFASPIRKNLTLKYYAKKILYFLRQQNILKSLKSFLEKSAEQQSALEGVTWIQTQLKIHCAIFLWI